jgi:hypothetical protein
MRPRTGSQKNIGNKTTGTPSSSKASEMAGTPAKPALSQIAAPMDCTVHSLFIDWYVIAGIHYVAIDSPNQQIAREMFLFPTQFHLRKFHFSNGSRNGKT